MPVDHIVREIENERANLIVLLSDARGLLAGSTVYLEALSKYAPHLAEGPGKLKERIDTFLNKGLFGDRQKGG